MLDAAKGHGPGAVRTLLAATRAVFKHATGKHTIKSNPAIGVERDSIVKPSPEPTRVALNDAEISRVLGALEDSPFGWTVRLHLMTGVRPAEVLHAAWEEFATKDGITYWTIPAVRTKNNVELVIRLPEQAKELLRKVKRECGKSRFLFPAAYGAQDKPVPYQTYRGRIRRLVSMLDGAVRIFRAHDLRRTMRTGLTSIGIRFEVAERAVNHAVPGVAARYDLAKLDEERQEALQKWADHLDQLERRANKLVGVNVQRGGWGGTAKRRFSLT